MKQTVGTIFESAKRLARFFLAGVKVVVTQRKHILATPNYGYEKRQKELAKKRKKEDKLKSKTERKGSGEDDAGGAEQEAHGPQGTDQASLPSISQMT